MIAVHYRDVRLRRYFDGRVVFLGDAAHCMSPQLGQGASMALLDASVLAQSLDYEDVAAALSSFDKRRRAHLAIYQRLSHLVTPIFQSGNSAAVAVRDRLFFPLTRLPFLERSLARTLAGTQCGLFGTLTLIPTVTN